MQYLIVGNPNTGKTTLFNELTNMHEKTANWTGVTVDKKEKTIQREDSTFKFVDLPGLYSLNIFGKDENVAKQNILNNSYPIIFVVNIDSIERNLYLCYELLKLNKKILLFVNTYGKKCTLNFNLFHKTTKIEVVVMDAKHCKTEFMDFLDNLQIVQAYSNIGTYQNFISLIVGKTEYRISKMDKLLFNKMFITFSFVLLFSLIIWISFGPLGSFLAVLIEKFLNSLSGVISTFLLSKNLFVLENYLRVVLFQSLGSIFVFLPQLVLLLTCTSFLESTGYLSRFAYHTNTFFEKFGMSGKSIFSLITGFGCTTSAVIVARGAGEKRVQRSTAQFLPFVGCSAKLPIVIYIASITFGSYGILVIMGLFIFVLILGIIINIITNDNERDQFIIELPYLRLPAIKKSITDTWTIVVEFIKRVLLVILIVSTFVWILLSIDTKLNFVLNSPESILYYIMSKLEFILVPIGISSWKILFALLIGLVAKENIISCLVLLGGVSEIGDYISSTSLLIFIFLYSPCIPALFSYKKEFGRRFSYMIFLKQTFLAYTSSFVFWTFSKFYNIYFGYTMLFTFLVLIMIWLKVFKRNSLCSCCKTKLCINK